MSRSIHSDNFSTTSSQWTTSYKRLPKKQPSAIRFMSWAAGAPRGATMVKKRTRDTPDDRSDISGWSSSSWGGEQDTQLYWVVSPGYYYSGSSSSSSSSSSRSSRSSRKKKSSPGKHFNGAVPPPPMMPPPGGPGFDAPMDGHYAPPPPPDMGGYPGSQYGGSQFGGSQFGGSQFGGFSQPPPPPMPMGHPPPAAGGAPAFFDLTGQQPQQGGHFNRGPHGPGGFHAPSEDDYWSETDSE